jgi:hypothetical protein
MFAAGFLLGAIFGACVAAATLGALHAAKRDDASRLNKLYEEVAQEAYPSCVHDRRDAKSSQRQYVIH